MAPSFLVVVVLFYTLFNPGMTFWILHTITSSRNRTLSNDILRPSAIVSAVIAVGSGAGSRPGGPEI
jgi:hypothetical protein